MHSKQRNHEMSSSNSKHQQAKTNQAIIALDARSPTEAICHRYYCYGYHLLPLLLMLFLLGAMMTPNEWLPLIMSD